MVERKEKFMRLKEKGEKVEVVFIWNDDELTAIKRTTWLDTLAVPLKHKECYYKSDNPEKFQEIMMKELEYLKKMTRLQNQLERYIKRQANLES